LAERLAPADILTPYGVEFRSPGALPPLTPAQGAQALQLAEQTRDLILASLQPYLSAGRPAGEGPVEGKGQRPRFPKNVNAWLRWTSRLPSCRSMRRARSQSDTGTRVHCICGEPDGR
jgi:hypothetical protein